jgi:hypothetical protein
VEGDLLLARNHAKVECVGNWGKQCCQGPDKAEHCPRRDPSEYCGHRIVYSNYFCDFFPKKDATPFPVDVPIPIDYGKCPTCWMRDLCSKKQVLSELIKPVKIEAVGTLDFWMKLKE